jgi:hypothetical protein
MPESEGRLGYRHGEAQPPEAARRGVRGGAIALAVIVLGTLASAVLGGRVGRGYHRKVDSAGYAE